MAPEHSSDSYTPHARPQRNAINANTINKLIDHRIYAQKRTETIRFTVVSDACETSSTTVLRYNLTYLFQSAVATAALSEDKIEIFVWIGD
jgi:hypothetical protein